MKKIVIGTRGSRLALWQAEHIKALLEENTSGLKVEVKVIKTTGDKILDVPLAKIGGKGLFTKEIETAMMSGEVDLAVHSLKDVPVEFPEGLVLSAITKREDVRDCLLSEKYSTLNEMPENGVLGTTSLRRAMQAKSVRPDLTIRSLRGNVNTRIRKLKDGEFDAILLATAGVNRLDLWNEVEYVNPIDTHVMIPAMGQAALGIEVVKDSYAHELSLALNDKTAVMETTVERRFIEALEGGCQVPIGINARVTDENKIKVDALIGLPDGTEMLRDNGECSIDEYESYGAQLAEQFIQRGARELLERAEKMAWH